MNLKFCGWTLVTLQQYNFTFVRVAALVGDHHLLLKIAKIVMKLTVFERKSSTLQTPFSVSVKEGHSFSTRSVIFYIVRFTI